MKVLRSGRQSAEWSRELKCTGKGNGGRGCQALLLVGKADLFKTCSTTRNETEWFATFKCPECGVMTDLETWPTCGGDLVPRLAWEAHQAKAGESPGETTALDPLDAPADLVDALREHTEALRASRVAPVPTPPPETRTPAGDRLRDAARVAIREVNRTGSLQRHDEEFDALVAAAEAYDALPAAPASQPRTTVEAFCSTAEGAALFEREATALAASEAVAARRADPSPPRVLVDPAALEELREAAGMAVTATRAGGLTPVASKAVGRLDRALAVLNTPAPEATPPCPT